MYDQKNEYVPHINKPIEEIMKELDEISKSEFKSAESRRLNEYFFKNKSFLNKFINCAGGSGSHHGYKGGLAEHTLNVVYMTRVIAYRYDCSYKEIVILGAKIHDIGKVEQYVPDGELNQTLWGRMAGHVVIGAVMLEQAFKADEGLYSDEFKNRLRGCLVQHHGKVQYGSPVPPNTEEAFIVHFADYIDATFNKVGQIKDKTVSKTWSDFDDRIQGQLYI